MGGILLEDGILKGYLIIRRELSDGEFDDDSYAIEDIEDLMDLSNIFTNKIFICEPFDPYKVLKFYINLLSNPEEYIEEYTSTYCNEDDE